MIKRLISISLFAFAALTLVFPRDAHALIGEGPVVTVVGCGPTKKITRNETLIQVGTYCTSSSPPYDAAKEQLAIDDANHELQVALDALFRCDTCPQPQVGCVNTGGTELPEVPFKASDCGITVTMNCQGNPAKRLITATCRNEITYSYECSGCDS